ncbi:MAG: hypothetical protein ABR529_02030 [Actinomycetota bacterium]
MSPEHEEYLDAYLLTKGATRAYLDHVESLEKATDSPVHFVFRLVGAWDSLTVIQAAPGNLEGIHETALELTAWKDGARPMLVSLAFPWDWLGRIIKRKLPLFRFEAIVALRAEPGAVAGLVAGLTETLPGPEPTTAGSPQFGIQRVEGDYDLLCEVGANSGEDLREAVEMLRAAVGQEGALDVSFAVGLEGKQER